MNKRQIAFGFFLGLAPMVDAQPPAVTGAPSVTDGISRVHDAQGMYARASYMLEDRSIQNVSSVPAMLEGCARAGHIPATLLLLDVYEGKFKGLAEQPQKAAVLAYKLASVKPVADETKEARALRREAMFRCAIYCERGYGCKKNVEDAYKWMLRAAAENVSKARVELARYLMMGIGHKRAPKMARRLLLEQTVKNPDTPHLYYYLGHMCYYGIGMSRPDRKAALHWFEKGNEKGDARAINNLGIMYERGIVVSPDTVVALRLYKKAAAAGSREASANMQRLGFKAGEEAAEKTTYAERIDNAGLRVLKAMPLPEHMRELLGSLFRSGEAVH